MSHKIASYTDKSEPHVEKQVRYCTKCGAEERELTTDCPGTYVEQAQRNNVANGIMDFRGGKWINQARGELKCDT